MKRDSSSMGRCLLLVAAVLLFACGEPAPRLAPLPADGVVLAFGDSLTFGTGVDAAHSYPAVLSGLIGRTVVRSGVPGELSAAGLERLPRVLDQYAPRLLILCHGGNDLLRKLAPATTEANLRAMTALARERGIDVVLVGVPQPGLALQVPELYRRVARDYGVPYEGEILRSVLRFPQTKSDLMHPNGRGYREIAEALAHLLRRAGAL